MNGELEQFQAVARQHHIDGFENNEQHVDFGWWIGDESGEQAETEVGATRVAYDAYTESSADFVAAKRKKINLHFYTDNVLYIQKKNTGIGAHNSILIKI